MKKKCLLGSTIAELQEWSRRHNLPRFVSGQIAEWVYRHHQLDPQLMTNLSKENRGLLAEEFVAGDDPPREQVEAADKTRKYLFPVDPAAHRYVEAALIPDRERATLCLSTQSGCRMGCVFCQTGRQGLNGNLSVAQIINQYHSLPERDRITNIVYMGMGEPFDNTGPVLASLEVFTAEWGYRMSPTRITVSTAGLLPGLKRFLAESRCHLAVSLHAARQEVRERLLPAAKKYPLSDLIALLENHRWEPQRRLTFEYIVFPGINNSAADARLLAAMARRLKARVNLLQWHRVDGLELPGSSRTEVEQFQTLLQQQGAVVTIRRSRGEEIGAACGLLSTARLQEGSE